MQVCIFSADKKSYLPTSYALAGKEYSSVKINIKEVNVYLPALKSNFIATTQIFARFVSEVIYKMFSAAQMDSGLKQVIEFAFIGCNLNRY